MDRMRVPHHAAARFLDLAEEEKRRWQKFSYGGADQRVTVVRHPHRGPSSSAALISSEKDRVEQYVLTATEAERYINERSVEHALAAMSLIKVGRE